MSYKLSQELIAHSQDVKSVAFIDNDTLISGARDNTAMVWNRSDDGWKVAARIQTHDNYVNSVGFLRDERVYSLYSLYSPLLSSSVLVATGSQDTLVNLHQLQPFPTEQAITTPAYTLLGHSANVCAIDATHDLLATGSWDT